MQTYTQTFATATTWPINVPGKYYTTLACTLPVTVRFFKGGKRLDLGEITGLLAGLEVTLGDIGSMEAAFDKVEIDVQAGDTVSVGIGNGQARYNRAQGSVAITQGKAPTSNNFTPTAATVTNANGQLLAVNTGRQYLLIQNRDTAGTLYVRFGATAATLALGIKIPPGQFLEMADVIPTGAVQCIGDIASNANVLVVEG